MSNLHDLPCQLRHYDGAVRYFASHPVHGSQASAISTLLQLHLLVVIFAGTTILGRLATVSAPVLVTWRCLLAALGAFLWVAMMRDRKVWLGGKAVAKLLGVGAIIGLHWLCLFGAVKIANVSIALANFLHPLLRKRFGA